MAKCRKMQNGVRRCGCAFETLRIPANWRAASYSSNNGLFIPHNTACNTVHTRSYWQQPGWGSVAAVNIWKHCVTHPVAGRFIQLQ